MYHCEHMLAWNMTQRSMGYGIFAANEFPSKAPPDQGSVVKTFLASAISSGLSGSESVGATKWEWDPVKRELRQAWISPLKLIGGMCIPSSANGILYCISRRNDKFVLECINWKSGKSAVHYMLGKSVKFFPYNNLVVAPNGSVDLLTWLGMGIMRMKPKP